MSDNNDKTNVSRYSYAEDVPDTEVEPSKTDSYSSYRNGYGGDKWVGYYNSFGGYTYADYTNPDDTYYKKNRGK